MIRFFSPAIKFLKEFSNLWIVESWILFLVDRFISPFKSFDIPKRKKTSVMICGSGWSLNNISEKQWSEFENSYDIFSFNAFKISNYCNITFHLVREFESYFLYKRVSRLSSCFNFKEIKKYDHEIKSNPYMDKAELIVLHDRKSGQAILWRWMASLKHKTLSFYSNHSDRLLNWPPSNSMQNIPHSCSTLNDCINICYLMGYEEILLAGVDLNDRRYFYLEKDESRDFDMKNTKNFNDRHATADTMIAQIRLWRNFLEPKGIRLLCQNSNSLLSEVIGIKISAKANIGRSK